MGPSILEIDLKALAHNYRYIRSIINPNTKLLGVVKANAYGSESKAIAKKLEGLGIDYLGVAYTQEGVFLREQGLKVPILVMHPQPEEFKDIIRHCLEPNLYSKRTLEQFIEVAHKETHYPVHIKINTGLNRLGFSTDYIGAIGGLLKNTTAIKVRGLLSHLAATDDLDQSDFTRSQIEKFTKAVTEIEGHIGAVAIKHLLNSSGILNFPEASFSMVRSGIALYGYSNDPAEDRMLKTVATLKTKISQIHVVEAGDWVGYNKGFVAKKKMKIATLSIGHADGISRTYGQGKGFVYLKGKACPIVGNICMDMLMIDLGSLEAQEGDTVVVFGQGASAETFAAAANTISYELLTAIGPRVKRVIID